MEITNNLGLKCPDKNETFDVEHMNDNMKILDEIWKVIYPVGSIYISVNTVSPEVLFGGGTWELVASNRVLMGTTDAAKVGTTVAAGLPNIKGEIHANVTYSGSPYSTGAFSGAFYPADMDGTQDYYVSGRSPGSGWRDIGLDASLSNSIYGNSTTVQPPALLVYFWQRTA